MAEGGGDVSTEEKLGSIKSTWLEHQGKLWSRLMERCESPIEQLLLGAFLIGAWGREMDWPADVPGSLPPGVRLGLDALMFAPIFHTKDSHETCAPVDRQRIVGTDFLQGVLVAQHEVAVAGHNYRLDFAIISWERGQRDYAHRVAIEVDGHDFHERTKEQAARDRSRDRALTAAGWLVIRFTGSEVWRDPVACVAQVSELLTAETLRRDDDGRKLTLAAYNREDLTRSTGR